MVVLQPLKCNSSHTVCDTASPPVIKQARQFNWSAILLTSGFTTHWDNNNSTSNWLGVIINKWALSYKHDTIDFCCATSYNFNMIKSFKHKGLKLFFESGNTSGIQTTHSKKIRLQLTALDTSTGIEDMNLPGYNLHELKGNKKGIWSITVNGNWRITFQFEQGDAYIVNYEDYH